jgi:rod shape-determining protein MreC
MIRSRSNSATLLLLLALALALLGLDRLGHLEGAQDATQRGLGPVERLLTNVSQALSGFTTGLSRFSQLQSENEQLRAELEQLRLVSVQREEAEQENRQLRALLDFKRDNPNYTLLVAQIVQREPPAHVTGYDPSNLVEAIRIDQGQRDGVAIGMPVVTALGLAGRIAEVGENWAKVLLILDETSAVTALVQQSRASGVVEGLGNRLILRYIPHNQSIEPGDIVLTAGLGGEFPKGLVVGTVDTIIRQDVNPYQEARVRSPIDFTQLEYVFVIKNWQPARPALP